MTQVAIVIVSYNVQERLRACLESVCGSAARASDGLDVSVVVVDNHSDDGSAEMVANTFPSISLYSLPENAGFTGANNLALWALGFAVAPPAIGGNHPRLEIPLPDYVLLLNPDAELVGDALVTMVDLLVRDAQVGVCGPRLQYGSGAFQQGAFRFPSLIQVAIDFFPLDGVPGIHRLHNSALNGRYAMERWQAGEPFRVDFVLGAAMMVRGQCIQQVGGLDAGYWMYCEEMDLCLRLRDLGWTTYAVPAAQVIHHGAQSSRQRPWRSFERLWRSRFRFYSLHSAHYPPGYLLALRAIVRAGINTESRKVRAAFASGAVSGVEAAEALNTLDAVARM